MNVLLSLLFNFLTSINRCHIVIVLQQGPTENRFCDEVHLVNTVYSITEKRARTVGGDHLHVSGMTDIQIRENGLNVNNTFSPVKMQNQSIFGINFLKANGMVVKIAKELLSQDPGRTGLFTKAAAPTINELQVLLEIRLVAFLMGRVILWDGLAVLNVQLNRKNSISETPAHRNKVMNNHIYEKLARNLFRKTIPNRKRGTSSY